MRDVRSTAATSVDSERGEDPSFCHLPGVTGSTVRPDGEIKNATKISHGTNHCNIY
jgi:hypothetical protein